MVAAGVQGRGGLSVDRGAVDVTIPDMSSPDMTSPDMTSPDVTSPDVTSLTVGTISDEDGAVPVGMVRKLVRNAARCGCCGDLLESTRRPDTPDVAGLRL